MELIDRVMTSHRYAVNAVQRAVSSAVAYSQAGPNLLHRWRLYLLVLRERFAQGG